MTDEAGRVASPLTEGLGLAPERDEVLRQLDDRTNQTWVGKRARWAALVRAQDAEIERLRAALAKANEQAERFERGWYLRGDALEGVLPYMEAAETAGLVGDEGCHWQVEAVRAALKA